MVVDRQAIECYTEYPPQEKVEVSPTNDFDKKKSKKVVDKVTVRW